MVGGFVGRRRCLADEACLAEVLSGRFVRRRRARLIQSLLGVQLPVSDLVSRAGAGADVTSHVAGAS